jgi:hypothetical protein
MRIVRFGVALLIAAAFSAPVWAQSDATDDRPRFLLDGEIGNLGELGYKIPSTAIGPGIEVPIESHFEIQANATYSPDRKLITDNGNSLDLGGSVIGFATNRLGFIASLDHTALWTSEFDKKSWAPAAGVVLRNDLFGPARLYVTYLMPAGCVWATPTNPCPIQSNRLQGVQVHEDVQGWSHGRWGLDSGVYHFCDEGNPNEPAAGRHCHMGATMMATFTLDFHLGRRNRSWTNGAPPDNF